MNKVENINIPLNNLYAFVDPTAKGENKSTFHLFAVGKGNFGFFLHNGAQFFLDNLQQNSPRLVFYTSSKETNLFGEEVVSKNFHQAHISNKIVDLLTTNFFCINGIENSAIEAIKPLMREQNLSLKTCRQYDNLFACVQKREKNNKYKQTSLEDFCK